MNTINTNIISGVRKRWIDWLRGLSMLAILLYHTEYYYTGHNVIPYYMYVGDALCFFFFLSGYLFQPTDTVGQRPQTAFIQGKLKSILRSLLLPYFIYTAIIAVPKALWHGTPVAEGLIGILTGRASWFVAALIVAQLLFLAMLVLSHSRQWVMVLLSVVSAVGCWALVPSDYANYINYPWQLENALFVIPVLCGGWLYRIYEPRLSILSKPQSLLVLAIAVIGLKCVEYSNDYQLWVEPVIVDNLPVFALDLTITTLLMVGLAKLMPPMRTLEWTGSHSLVYYFFCGAVPLLVSYCFNRAGITYNGHYILVIIVLLPVYIVTSVIAYLVYRFLPFTVGKWGNKKP